VLPLHSREGRERAKLGDEISERGGKETMPRAGGGGDVMTEHFTLGRIWGLTARAIISSQELVSRSCFRSRLQRRLPPQSLANIVLNGSPRSQIRRRKGCRAGQDSSGLTPTGDA